MMPDVGNGACDAEPGSSDRFGLCSRFSFGTPAGPAAACGVGSMLSPESQVTFKVDYAEELSSSKRH